MVRLYLVRHGKTYFEPHGRMKGQLDVPLNRRGRRQARAVAEYFRGGRIDALYASDLHRTREGADHIAEATGCPVTVSPLISERNWGLWQGLTSAEIAQERRAGRAGPDGYGPLGEPATDFEARSELFMQLVARRAGQTVVAVTHGGILKNVILPAMGLTAADRAAYTQDTGAISLLEHGGRGWRPVFLNRTPRRAAQYPPEPAEGS